MVSNLLTNAGEAGLRSPGGRNGNPLQYFCHGQRSLAGLQSMRSQRVRHDLATEHHQYISFQVDFLLIII